jgi:hypothetical protein
MFFHHISWLIYLGVIGCLAIAYYAYLGVRYQAAKIARFLRERGIFRRRPRAPHHDADDAYLPTVVSEDEAFFRQKQKINTVFAEAALISQLIHTIIASCLELKCSHVQMIQMLKSALNQHPKLKEDAFRQPLTVLILSEFERYEEYEIREEDLAEIWSDDGTSTPPAEKGPVGAHQ